VVDIVFNPFGVVGVSDSFCSDESSCQSKVWTRGPRGTRPIESLYPIPYAKPTFYSFPPRFPPRSAVFFLLVRPTGQYFILFHSTSSYFIILSKFIGSVQIFIDVLERTAPRHVPRCACMDRARPRISRHAAISKRAGRASWSGMSALPCRRWRGWYVLLHAKYTASTRSLARTTAHWRSLEIRPVVLQSRVRISRRIGSTSTAVPTAWRETQ